MDHLKQHANPTDDSSLQCIYCLENWADNDKLSRHLLTAHPVETKSHAGVECLICEVLTIWIFIQSLNDFNVLVDRFTVTCKHKHGLGQSYAKASCPSWTPVSLRLLQFCQLVATRYNRSFLQRSCGCWRSAMFILLAGLYRKNDFG